MILEIVGSNICSSFEGINEMLDTRDKKKFLDLCRRQIEWGADRIDLNCGDRLATEVDDMEWMVKTVTAEMEIPLMVDSPNPAAIEVALRHNRCGQMIVDSITCEKHRIETIMPIVNRYNAQVVVLLHDEKGMPQTVGDRLALMPIVQTVQKEYAMEKKDILIDSLVFPVAMDCGNGALYMECLKQLKQKYPEYAYACGLSNISYGMPQTDFLDISFASMLFALGQEYLFMEINERTCAFLSSDKALLGLDENTLSYLKAYRNQMLSVFK